MPTGGSAFGLSTAAGVVNYLYEHGHGVKTLVGRVPIVPAAVIFDLPVGDATIHPTPEWGYKAAVAATAGPVQQGNVGAGGTVGKSPGGIPLKGGLGTASFVLPGGVVVGAIVALNSLGDVVNPLPASSMPRPAASTAPSFGAITCHQSRKRSARSRTLRSRSSRLMPC